MSNYATAFVDFYVYYLVPVPYADVFASWSCLRVFCPRGGGGGSCARVFEHSATGQGRRLLLEPRNPCGAL